MISTHPKIDLKTIRFFLPIFCLIFLSCTPTPRQIKPPSPAHSEQISALIAERRYAAAVERLEEAAQNQPQNPDPLNKVGQIYLKQHRWLLAEDAFNRALARQPDNAPAVAGLAEIRLNQGEWRQSLDMWQKAAKLNPKLSGVFTGLGRTYLQHLEFDAAKEAFLQQQAIYFDPHAQWYLAAMEAPFNLQAARDYLLDIPPDAPADILARRDYLLTTLVPFTAESPPATVARATGIALLQAQMWTLAVYALQATDSEFSQFTNSEKAETLTFLGHALAQVGHPALDLFEQARQLDPASALPLYFYGIYLRRQNALEAAAQHFQQAIELDPNNAAIFVELAQTHAQQGNFIAAEAQYEAAMAAAPDDLNIQMLRLKFYGGRGYRLKDVGLSAAQALIKADKSNAEAHDWLGWIYFLVGRPEKAEDAFRQALKLDPELISARYHLARLLELNGQSAEALPLYRQVVDWDTSGGFRERTLQHLQQLSRNAKIENEEEK